MTLLLFILTLGVSLSIGVPVAFALIICAAAMGLQMDLFDPQVISQRMVVGANNFSLLAIPFFLLAGELMNAGGMSRRIIGFAMAFVGHVRGGLGVVAIFAAIILASLSGSAAADSAALIAIMLPMMKQSGHDEARSVGLMASGGVIAPIIPPSIAYIIFAVATNLSITQLFLAGIVPGVMMGLGAIIAWLIVARRDNVQPRPRQGWGVRLEETRKALWSLGMPVIILGGIRFGVVTPTEAAVIAAVYAIFVGMVVHRELKVSDLFGVFRDAALTTSVVMMLAAAALATAWFITIADLSGTVLDLVGPLVDSPTLLLIVIMALVLMIGTMLDMGPTILILAPVLLPVVEEAGIDPVYFGVLFVINCAIGLVTPPVGIVLSVSAGVSGVPLHKVAKGAAPFLIAQVTVLILLVLFPQLVLTPLNWLR
ncbi:trap dicarboxylate transporter, dctm subunit [Citreicella sp. SE45]|uniref:TRAP transporter large permease n=1 Tax=Salipiger sp. HF18 TaxID=2721557 RepID=UPI0001B8CC74|nr:TRAP transporter large permease subunit [Salipiger sp. HF18]EEX11740.1 trap dicarboxylate transporter, dctm subunit [Citreicella sp. SE45]MAU44773.1 L-dehydroascorbate transporter large permease subunit [Salipiger sp.]NIY94764.1 TRAP transporter large permease subunit [Salipiger sp. HF18]